MTAREADTLNLGPLQIQGTEVPVGSSLRREANSPDGCEPKTAFVTISKSS
jgi:hypothetical protein